MTVCEPLIHLPRALSKQAVLCLRAPLPSLRRNASSEAETPESPQDDVDRVAALDETGPVSEDVVKAFDPIKRSQARTQQLPKSR